MCECARGLVGAEIACGIAPDDACYAQQPVGGASTWATQQFGMASLVGSLGVLDLDIIASNSWSGTTVAAQPWCSMYTSCTLLRIAFK